MILTPDQVVDINKRLETLFGKHQVKNQANFRLSYAGNQLEKRSGEKAVFLEGTDIFLRTENGIHEVQKYPYIDNDTWIMERLVANYHQDVMEGDYVYECFYSFPTGILPPWRAVEFLMNAILVTNRHAPKSDKEAIYQYQQKLAQEKIEAREILDTRLDVTDISLSIKHGTGISMSGLDSKNLGEKNV